MGMSSSAGLVWGVKIDPEDYYDDDEGGLRELGHGLSYEEGGSYDWDAEDRPTILTHSGVESVGTYDEEAKEVDIQALSVRVLHGDVVRAQEAADAEGLDVNFEEAHWWLVASYG